MVNQYEKDKAARYHEVAFVVKKGEECRYCGKVQVNKRPRFSTCAIFWPRRANRKRDWVVKCTNLVYRGEHPYWKVLPEPEAYFNRLQMLLYHLELEKDNDEMNEDELQTYGREAFENLDAQKAMLLRTEFPEYMKVIEGMHAEFKEKNIEIQGNLKESSAFVPLNMERFLGKEQRSGEKKQKKGNLHAQFTTGDEKEERYREREPIDALDVQYEVPKEEPPNGTKRPLTVDGVYTPLWERYENADKPKPKRAKTETKKDVNSIESWFDSGAKSKSKAFNPINWDEL